MDYQSILIPNFETFLCPVCFLNVDPGEGIMLQECLHSFCKDCLIKTIECCDQVEVKCPTNCTKSLLDGEIRALLNKEALEKYQARSVQVAEMNILNSFHCRTVDCKGWCILDTIVEKFRCPVCNRENCVQCGAIHDNISCFQYQSTIQDKDVNKDSSEDMISKDLTTNLAMKCPKCQAVISKVYGCDFIRCSYCGTGICWATKGPRWGPNGEGDTSGGCACELRRCSPNCNNCH